MFGAGDNIQAMTFEEVERVVADHKSAPLAKLLLEAGDQVVMLVASQLLTTVGLFARRADSQNLMRQFSRIVDSLSRYDPARNTQMDVAVVFDVFLAHAYLVLCSLQNVTLGVVFADKDPDPLDLEFIRALAAVVRQHIV